MLTCITGGLWLLSTLFLLCLGCCGSYCCAKATRSRIAIRVVALCLLSHTLSFLLSAFALLRPLRTFALPVAEWCGDACRCRVGPWYLWHAIPLVGASAALLLWRRWARPRHNDKNHAQAQQQHTPLQQPSSMNAAPHAFTESATAATTEAWTPSHCSPAVDAHERAQEHSSEPPSPPLAREWVLVRRQPHQQHETTGEDLH
jgi:hypothetical protein